MTINRTSPKKGKVVDLPEQTITIGTATAGTQSASVAFTVASTPATGGPVSRYTAVSNPGGFTGTASSSPVVVSGLTNGTSYTFQVASANGSGNGPLSSASNSITPLASTLSLDWLVVAGGGGGSNGGGGAGGFRTATSQTISYGDAITVTVGAGGAGYPNTLTNGANSSLGSFSSTGGGRGTAGSAGFSGGSGSGGSEGGAAGAGNAGGYSPVEGYAGGAGNGGGYAGGGGAGGVGGTTSNTSTGGNGGVGAYSALTNAMGAATSSGVLSGGNYYFAGGGGGTATSTQGQGGLGGGGNAGYGQAQPGTANTGGGAGGTYTGGATPLNGGSGIVIMRYNGSITASSTTGSPTRYETGGYTYYKFTGNGTITF